MIIKIAKLENVGKFSTFTQENNFSHGEQQNCNIVYGFNGSGKTTLSNAISFFADNSFISEDEKAAIWRDIQNGDNSTVEIELHDKNKCKYPANQHDKNFYVFNSNFVSTHVFDGTKGRLKKFSNAAGGEIKNEAIEEANKKITELENDKKKRGDENDVFDAKLKDINKNNSAKFNNSLTDKNKKLTVPDLSKESLPSETVSELQQKLTVLAADYDLSKKQADLAVDLAALEQLVFQKCELDLNKINVVLNTNVQQLSKEILETKIKEVKSLFTDETYQQSTEKWFRFGKSILDKSKDHGGETKCPICDTDISDRLDALLQNFNGYFDKEYEDFIASLKVCTGQVQIAIDLIEQCIPAASTLERLSTKYKAQITEQVFVAFDFNAIKDNLKTIQAACNSKLDNIQFSFEMPQSAIDSLLTANIAIENFINLKNTSLTVLRAKKVDRSKVEDEIRATYKKITLLEFDQLEKGGNFEKYKQNIAVIANITTTDPSNVGGLQFYLNKRRDELKKIKAESKSISKFLQIMGIDHFIVDINEDEPDENIIIKYKSSGTDKNKLKNCLSDGEKTALAFAYFLSKFENERETEEKRKESVVVIDDPISSLDENRIYSTAYLIRDNFKAVKQLIVLSHNFLFLKFFNSSYAGQTNCLFISGDKLSELPEELRNFESPYFYMLKTVMDYAKNATDYVNAKKYLPNYIRRVLETFLSFKFAKIDAKRDNGKSRNKSPGLNEFDNNVDSVDLEESVKQDLKSKISGIVKIVDQHSHGNAQLTEESFYISETELKKLAQNAICVIDILDSVHKASTDNLVASSPSPIPARKWTQQT